MDLVITSNLHIDVIVYILLSNFIVLNKAIHILNERK